MKILNLVQGSPEWLAARAQHNTASEAPMMMDASPYTSRAELLRRKATGDELEVSGQLQAVFDRGHAAEAAARPIAEDIIGDELYPVTGLCEDTGLLASFDGLTMDESICWECKLWNEDKAGEVRGGSVPAGDFWQVAQQLLVSGAERCLYMVTDGTPEKSVHCWVDRSDLVAASRFEVLLDHWAQFDADLAAYVPQEVVVEPIGRAPDALPALRVEVTGMVTASNLDAFKEHALAVFAGINRELKTDDDFANADKTVKWCGEVEKKLEGAKEQALAQTSDIDALFRTIDAVKEEARSVRLELDKLVKARKQSLRAEIINGGNEALMACVVELSAGFPAGVSMPAIPADFPGVIKGKRSFASIRDAVDTELARAKIEAGHISARIHANLAAFEEFREGYGSLFRDLPALVLKEPGDFVAQVKLRIADYQAEQDRRLAAEAAEAKAKAEREAALAAAVPVVEPEPVAVPQPAPVVAPAAAVAPEPVPEPACPSYGDIVRAVAAHYGVGVGVASAWLDKLIRQQAA